jgi:hypothetical protein
MCEPGAPYRMQVSDVTTNSGGCDSGEHAVRRWPEPCPELVCTGRRGQPVILCAAIGHRRGAGLTGCEEHALRKQWVHGTGPALGPGCGKQRNPGEHRGPGQDDERTPSGHLHPLVQPTLGQVDEHPLSVH